MEVLRRSPQTAGHEVRRLPNYRGWCEGRPGIQLVRCACLVWQETKSSVLLHSRGSELHPCLQGGEDPEDERGRESYHGGWWEEVEAAKQSFFRLDVSSFPFTYIHTESHKYDDAELIDINLCLNNVDIHI